MASMELGALSRHPNKKPDSLKDQLLMGLLYGQTTCRFEKIVGVVHFGEKPSLSLLDEKETRTQVPKI
jgi:hypothetical protein